MNNLFDQLALLAKNEDQKEILQAELQRYKTTYLKKKLELLYKMSRLASTMIVGPANFPKPQQEKRHNSFERKRKEFWDWIKKAQNSIKRKINKATSKEEIEEKNKQQLLNDLQQATINEPRYIKTNAKSRIFSRVETLVYNGNTDKIKAILETIKKFQETNCVIFTDKHKIWKSLERAKKYNNREGNQGTETLFKFSFGKVINNHDLERTQIIFNDKPPSDVRDSLKSNGWRWSPKNKAWQRKITLNAKHNAKFIISQYYEIVHSETK